jgi:hypothetical protein
MIIVGLTDDELLKENIGGLLACEFRPFMLFIDRGKSNFGLNSIKNDCHRKHLLNQNKISRRSFGYINDLMHCVKKCSVQESIMKVNIHNITKMSRVAQSV